MPEVPDRPAPDRPGPDRPAPDRPGRQERRSFGGAAPIETGDGTLFPDLLITGPGRAILDARLALSARGARRIARTGLPELDGITLTDDRGARYALQLEAMSGHRYRPGGAAAPAAVSVRVEPAPEPGAAWFELGHRSGPVTRLLPSPRAAVQVSGVTPAPADAAGNRPGELADPPAGTTPGVADPADSGDSAHRAGLHLDLGAEIPALSGVETRLDSLVAGPGRWRLFLRAAPGWFTYSADRHRKWAPVAVRAQDDLGGGYVSEFGGSSGQGGHAEVTLTFAPRLDPLARRIRLTLRGAEQEVAVVVGLPGRPGIPGTAGDGPGR